MTDTDNYREMTRQTAGMVATALGAGWSCDTSELYESYPGVYLDGPDSARIFLTLLYSDRDKVEIRGVYPESANNVHPRVTHVEIKVGRFRGPEVIAKEINRRLLPKYLPELARISDRSNQDDAAQGQRDALAAKLTAVLPSASIDDYRRSGSSERPRETKMRLSIPNGFGDLQIDYRAEKVSMSLHGITAAQALAIAKILKGDQ